MSIFHVHGSKILEEAHDRQASLSQPASYLRALLYWVSGTEEFFFDHGAGKFFDLQFRFFVVFFKGP